MNDTTTAAEARAYFDERAHQWENERQDYFSNAVRNEIITRGAFAPDERIIDYGSGSGYLTQALLQSGVRQIVAIDVSPNMLIEMQQRYGSAIETRIAEDGRIPVRAASVDGLVSNMVLHHLEEPNLFFTECFRLLKPGGRAIITDLVAYDATEFAKSQQDRWTGFDLNQIRNWITEAGLTAQYVGPTGHRCCAAVSDAKGGTDIFLAHVTRALTL